jgi:hypothetical protein
MRNILRVCAGVLLLLTPLTLPAAPQESKILSGGKTLDLRTKLEPEKPTLFVFYKPDSSLERDFVEKLKASTGEWMGLRLIALKTRQEPLASQYSIAETPTALIYDRRGRLTGRSSHADEIQELLKKARGVMRLDWAEEGDAKFLESVRLLGRPPGNGILRTMTLQPEYLKYINDLSMKAHFSDGYLPRRIKEMIATYVSQLNKCKY